MQDSTAKALQAVAPKILSGQYTATTPFCPEVVKRAIAVLEALKDGEWHTAQEIGDGLSVSKRYVQEILRLCAEAWELERGNRKGWRCTLHFCPKCRSVYYPDPDDWHECDHCGWWKQDDQGRLVEADMPIEPPHPS